MSGVISRREMIVVGIIGWRQSSSGVVELSCLTNLMGRLGAINSNPQAFDFVSVLARCPEINRWLRLPVSPAKNGADRTSNIAIHVFLSRDGATVKGSL